MEVRERVETGEIVLAMTHEDFEPLRWTFSDREEFANFVYVLQRTLRNG